VVQHDGVPLPDQKEPFPGTQCGNESTDSVAETALSESLEQLLMKSSSSSYERKGFLFLKKTDKKEENYARKK
jgi:hypothetical protein